MQTQKISKTMSYALRHHPETLGLVLSSEGFVELTVLAHAISVHLGAEVTVETIKAIAEADEKQRFTIIEGHIRAAQGHSFHVSLNLAPETPPMVLFHGTVENAIPGILQYGLRPMTRQYVHLSETSNTALQVGARRGTPILLSINTEAAAKQGVEFYKAENGVWLAKHVPADTITIN